MEFKNYPITDIRIQSLGNKNRWALVTHSNMVGTKFVEVQGYCVVDALLELDFWDPLLRMILT